MKTSCALKIFYFFVYAGAVFVGVFLGWLILNFWTLINVH